MRVLLMVYAAVKSYSVDYKEDGYGGGAVYQRLLAPGVPDAGPGQARAGQAGRRLCEGAGGGLFSIRDVRCFSAQGLDIAGADVEAILARAAAEIDRG